MCSFVFVITSRYFIVKVCNKMETKSVGYRRVVVKMFQLSFSCGNRFRQLFLLFMCYHRNASLFGLAHWFWECPQYVNIVFCFVQELSSACRL